MLYVYRILEPIVEVFMKTYHIITYRIAAFIVRMTKVRDIR